MLDIRTLGSRIKELRKERGLTQDAFAGAIHVSFQAVSNWERGIAPPEIENLINKITLLQRVNKIENSDTTVDKIWFMVQTKKMLGEKQ